jgi:hypothetical protein
LAVMSSLADACGEPLAHHMRHPLLHVAAAYYRRPTEAEAILPFLEHRLIKLGIQSEDGCPSAYQDLVGWVKAGVAHGRRMRRKDRNGLCNVWKCVGRPMTRAVSGMVQGTVKRAGGLNPLCLTAGILEWMHDTVDWTHASEYGWNLEKLVRFADYAVWIGWTAGTPFATRRCLTDAHPSSISHAS